MAHTFFLSKSLCFFLLKLMFLRYSQCQGWLAGFFTLPTGRKRLCGLERLSALWLTWWQGGQRCEESWHSQWSPKDRAPHSSLTLLNRERMCERDRGKSVKQTERERECVWKGKRGTMLKRQQFKENVTHNYQGRRWKAAAYR